MFLTARKRFYTQRDDPNPQSAYAEAKLLGERLPGIIWPGNRRANRLDIRRRGKNF
jgi:hypothetical protein